MRCAACHHAIAEGEGRLSCGGRCKFQEYFYSTGTSDDAEPLSSDDQRANKFARLLKMARLAKLLKMLRLARVKRLLDRWEEGTCCAVCFRRIITHGYCVTGT
eukprot:SAG31_NODE_1070_length_10071_cov_6.989771_14_plen_103_part_00